MRKRVLGILIALVVCMTSMSAAACSGGKKDGEFDVLFLANNKEIAFYEAHFASVATELGVKINFTGVAHDNYYDKLTTEINGNNVPDILYIKPSDIREFVSSGIIADITSELEKYSTTMDRVYDVAKEIYQYDKATKQMKTGATYAVPKDLSVQQLGYNKTLIERKAQLIEAAGLKLPWNMNWASENYTWDEYKTMAGILNDTSDSKNPIYGCDIPNIEILTWSFGGSILSEDLQTVQINSAAFKQAVQYQAELIASGAGNYQGATFDNFVSGKVAFYGEVNSFDIKNYDDYFSNLDMEWDIMPWPVASETDAPTSWTGKITSAGYAVSEKCKDKAKAVEIIMSLLTDKTQTKLVATDKLMLPLFADMAESFIDPDFDSVYSPKSRSIYIDVINGDNGKFSDDYMCFNLTWQDPYKVHYLELIHAASADKVLSLIKTDEAYSSMQADVQKRYDQIKNR